MFSSDLEQLELLADLDSLAAELAAWSDAAPDWPQARDCQAVVKRLLEQTDILRIRLSAPLVVATMGGTGTGKSTLVNALIGSEVTEVGRQRPTTRTPTMICRPEITPAELGIEPAAVRVVHRELPALRNLVIIDCPDPDTNEQAEAGTNLERLRRLLPHCDVLLVTGTQQKYRSARVNDELAAAAAGARLVFVQTHADVEEDIRADWRNQLSERYSVEDIFLIDSLAALADAQQGLDPRGDFAKLVDLLTRQLAGASAARIRRANFLDLLAAALDHLAARIDEGLPAVKQLEQGITEQRERLARKLAIKTRDELIAGRQMWESRLLGEIAGRWGLSPFSVVLRTYQGLGRLATGAMFARVRTPAQLALWGTFEGLRSWRRRQQEREAEAAPTRAATWGWDEAELRTAAIIVDGYADETGLPRDEARLAVVTGQAARAGSEFVEVSAQQLQAELAATAEKHTRWFTRFRYDFMFGLVAAFVLFRWGYNFIWESWLSPWPRPLYGLDFLVNALLLVLAWSALLVWGFTTRIRRGLSGQFDSLVEIWSSPLTAGEVFVGFEHRCRRIRTWGDRLQRISGRVAVLRERVGGAGVKLGHRVQKG